MKKIMVFRFIIALFAVFLGMGCNPSPSPSASTGSGGPPPAVIEDSEDEESKEEQGNNDGTGGGNGAYRFSESMWGEWIRMDKDETWYISGTSIKINNSVSSKSVSLSKQSDRVIKVTGDGDREYYLYASRIANTSFTGKVAQIIQTSPSINHISPSMLGSVAGGKGWISVVVEDLDNGSKKTTETDGEGKFTVPDIIPGDEYKVTPEDGAPTIVTPIADGDDVGIITITQGVNFKASIKAKDSSTDMNRLYAQNTYKLNLVIENTGDTDCTAATCKLKFDNDLIAVSVPASSVLGTIEPGKNKTLEITVGCQPIQNEYEFKKIGITITDTINNKTWEDSVSLKFNKVPVTFNIRADNAVSGIIIMPNGKAYSLLNVTSSSLTMPWSASDYLVVFSGATADTEAIYSLGVNVMPDTNWTDFSDLSNYESNNTETAATQINVQDKIMSYLHKNDIDYYKINLGSAAPELKPVSLVDFAYTDIDGNGDEKIQPSESVYLDIRVKNNTNATTSISPIVLTSASPYVTIDAGTRTVGDVEAGYYATLISGSSPYASVALLYSPYGSYLSTDRKSVV
jgi:hypothetical protein